MKKTTFSKDTEIKEELVQFNAMYITLLKKNLIMGFFQLQPLCPTVIPCQSPYFMFQLLYQQLCSLGMLKFLLWIWEAIS